VSAASAGRSGGGGAVAGSGMTTAPVAGSSGAAGQAGVTAAPAFDGGAAGSDAGSGGTAGASGQAGATAAAGHASSSSGCSTPPAAGDVLGWAAAPGMGAMTTTGGGTLQSRTVSTLAEFTAAVSGDMPAVVYVKGKLQPGSVPVGSNKTIAGVCDAEFHGHLGISGKSNIIVRNLKIVGYGSGNCALDPKYDAAVGCSSGDDAVTVQNSHHVWFDHCDVSDGTDGNLDITNGADFVTVSWTKFHYSPRSDGSGDDSTGAAGHRFSNLIGGADGVPADQGHLNVTWHHDWWADNVNQRMPRTRAGKIHLWNNLFTASGNSYCTNAGYQATLLVESNVYLNVSNPLSPDADGDMREHDNVFTNTKGTKSAAGKGFEPPYMYKPDPVATVESAVRSGAGPH
jgi:pectate lyase